MDRVAEQQLIARAQQGDSEAMATLYQTHVQAIYRYVYHRVSNPQLAEDLTGDVFARVVKDLPKYKDRGKPFLAWVYRIAHARVVDHYRKVNRRPDLSDVESEPVSITPDMDESLIREQASQALRTAITDLTDEQQQVIILRFIEGYRIDAVAQVMGKKPNAIKALQHRALRALASRLERSGFDVESVMAGLS